MRKRMVWLTALAVCLPQTSFAYVDPGTGAYAVQMLVAVLGATVFYISHPIELLRRVKRKLLKRKDES